MSSIAFSCAPHSLSALCLGLVVLALAACETAPRSEPGTSAAEPGGRAPSDSDTVYVRINQVGYLVADTKVAIAFSRVPVQGDFTLVDAATGEAAYRGHVTKSPAEGWGAFAHYYELDFSDLRAPGRYFVRYELAPTKFGDAVNALGQPRPNGIPDVLDEARWGLDWLHKLHPASGLLFHQVADDRDHIGWKWPDRDSSDYGWGPNSYRVVYFANGRPQGLREHKSEATGVANLAGRVAAAMAMAYRTWKDELGDPVFAERCLRAARSAYAMGKAREGFQQGNSYGAPYRYTEDTWADDMEWGAAALYKATGDAAYLEDARHYARLAGRTSWMSRDTTEHYRFYPFVNVGHFALDGTAGAIFMMGFFGADAPTALRGAE